MTMKKKKEIDKSCLEIIFARRFMSTKFSPSQNSPSISFIAIPHHLKAKWLEHSYVCMFMCLRLMLMEGSIEVDYDSLREVKAE